MISPSCNFDEFLERLRGLDYQQIRDAVRAEKREAMTIRKVGRYVEMLNGLGWLIDTGTRPSSVHTWEFMKMRPVIDSLVERRQLRPEALAIFQD